MQKIEVVVRITKDHCPPQEQTIFEWFDLMRNPTDALSRPDLEINLEHHRVFKHGTEVYMSRYEYGVLSLMAQHPGKLFTKEQIFEAVWHKDSESYLRAVTSTIGRIRQKIEDDKDHPRYIKTVSNIGYVANEPKVSFRNGQFIVTDGQHTIEGRILRNGGKDLPILCKVYTGMTVEQEALLFAEQNGFSAPLTAGIKLRAKVVGGDAISKAFLAATNRVGLSLNYDSQQLTDYRIGCVGTAFRLYKQMGEPLYCETMRLIVAAWEGKPDSFRASVLKGMMHFVELYHGEFSEERLLRALRSIHPVDIYRIGQDDPAKLRGWKKYVFPIYTAYNGKRRKDALPMKF